MWTTSWRQPRGNEAATEPTFLMALILDAVGVLQFDVTMARLKTEYGVDASYETIEYAAPSGSSAPTRSGSRSSRRNAG
jgi:peptide subunit release factor RF-3